MTGVIIDVNNIPLSLKNSFLFLFINANTVLYATFLAKVFRDSFTAAIPDMITISDKLINGTVAAQLTASLMAVSCITVTFCVNLTMVQDKAN